MSPLVLSDATASRIGSLDGLVKLYRLKFLSPKHVENRSFGQGTARVRERMGTLEIDKERRKNPELVVSSVGSHRMADTGLKTRSEITS